MTDGLNSNRFDMAMLNMRYGQLTDQINDLMHQRSEVEQRQSEIRNADLLRSGFLSSVHWVLRLRNNDPDYAHIYLDTNPATTAMQLLPEHCRNHHYRVRDVMIDIDDDSAALYGKTETILEVVQAFNLQIDIGTLEAALTAARAGTENSNGWLVCCEDGGNSPYSTISLLTFGDKTCWR